MAKVKEKSRYVIGYIFGKHILGKRWADAIETMTYKQAVIRAKNRDYKSKVYKLIEVK